MTIKYLFAFSMAVAALSLPRTGQAQSCENGTCETWAVYDSGSNAIVGGSYYENFYDSIANVNVYIWDPNNNYTSLGGAVNDSYVEVDFTYTPQMSGTYTVAGYNYYMLEDNPWAPDGYSSTTVYAGAPPPYIASCSVQGSSWIDGQNEVVCSGQFLSGSAYVSAGGPQGSGFMSSGNATVVSDTQIDATIDLGTILYNGAWIIISDGDDEVMISLPEIDPAPTVEISGGRGWNAGYLIYGPLSDNSVKYFNQVQATGTPPGGQYTWSVSQPNNLTLNSADTPDSVWPIIVNASTSPNDTTITVNYTYNGVAAQPATMKTTDTIYRYLLQSDTYNPVGAQPYGYYGYLHYGVYGQPGQYLIAADGIVDDEVISQISVTLSGFASNLVVVQGSGSTDTQGRVVDYIAIVSPNQLPANLRIVDSQTISVEGIYVRSNTLTLSNSTVGIQSNGPGPNDQ